MGVAKKVMKSTKKLMKSETKVMKSKKTAMKLAMKTVTNELTKSKQHQPCGPGCIATSSKGVPCKHPRAGKGLPYCARCMKTGDPSLKVCQHPKYGKILVAARKIPKGYYVAWWGKVSGEKQMTLKAMEWALETTCTRPKKYIDATPFKGSQLQFTACPGPSEVANINFAPGKQDVCLLDVKEKKSCLLFSTFREIPKSHQFTMMYNKDEKTTNAFFKDMGLTRADVGTPKYPAPRKASKGPAKR